MRFSGRWVATLLFATALGCSQSEWDRIPLEGTARLDGTVVSGAMTFIPVGSTSGPSATAAIANGQFAFSRTDGPVAGEYQVELDLDEEKPTGAGDGEVVAPPTLMISVPAEPPFEMTLDFQSDEQ